ncbi:MAG: serine/threonine protein phosphatase [Sulfuricurvum sp. PC08-66]|nr:MAG: serine/threonine protein phosphatase [Sulfuricurvum sp. PC08-66]
MKYKSIFISDVHLGTRYSKAQLLYDFLAQNSCENIYLVGDIIDGWVIKRKFTWHEHQTQVLERLFALAKGGMNVYYFAGNHDDFLRRFLPFRIDDRIHIVESMTYEALNGKRYLVMHGDQFDNVSVNRQWLAELGDWWYNLFLSFNTPINILRKMLGRKDYWSFSRAVKNGVKRYASKKTNFKEMLFEYVTAKGYDGIIFGHIHKVEISRYKTIDYINCGDWVESCTAIVENYDGSWEVVQIPMGL